MSTTLYGKTYYNTIESCRIAGLTKATFLRWAKYGVLPYVERKSSITQLDIKSRQFFNEQGLVKLQDIQRLKHVIVKLKRNVYLRSGKRIDIL